MARLLLIETTGDVCSVAIAENGNVLAVKEDYEKKSHAAVLTMLIQDLLTEVSLTIRDLQGICVSQGPGSYTGLRIGVSVAKGICYGAGLPLLAVNTLLAMSYGMRKELNSNIFSLHSGKPFLFCPMTDARRMEVYTALLNENLEFILETTALVLREDSFSDYLSREPILFFGSGAEKASKLIRHPNAFFRTDFRPRAAYLAEPADFEFRQQHFRDVAYFEPFYLKDFVATIPKKKLSI
ncbi:MAG: tRNA (adenosine(37)-N6)-threonylcarbamoyltransferase complex dimerization subunit type 1 TsaB [Bacteroidales bacterium]|nr:tRNA (adenosine(37)-N6)-threonylcarbamoyltransferase complex dimerization subunit type 1 TsaB [Bacteroidales bacterium]